MSLRAKAFSDHVLDATNAWELVIEDASRLAGLPLTVIDRAKTILAKLESDDTAVTLPAVAPVAKPRKKISVSPLDDSQLNLL